jgi:hypothetical protein
MKQSSRFPHTVGHIKQWAGPCLRATVGLEQVGTAEIASALRTDARKVLIAASKDVIIIS